MGDFTDLAPMVTVAGALPVVVLIVQVVKRWVTGDTTLWQRLSTILGPAVVLAATIVVGPVTAASVILAVLNGLVVGLAAPAAFDKTIR